MPRVSHHITSFLIVGLITALPMRSGTAQVDTAWRGENLKVLPADISREALNEIMLENLRGLGLPRRQNQGCLYCHEGDMDTPSDEWNFAADDNPRKEKARIMMAMVNAINGTHLSQLSDRVDSSFRVSCYTCHTGRTDPRPLLDVLRTIYQEAGIEEAVEEYRRLRARYFGADAYDFRPGVLGRLGLEFAERGQMEDGMALAELDAELHASQRGTRRLVLLMRLEQVDRDRGLEASLAEFDRLLQEEEGGIVNPSLLDNFGWRMSRRGRPEDAILVFRRNLAQFPDLYIPNESLADALWFSGQRAAGRRIFEAWVERHPDDIRAQRRLANLRP